MKTPSTVLLLASALVLHLAVLLPEARADDDTAGSPTAKPTATAHEGADEVPAGPTARLRELQEATRAKIDEALAFDSQIAATTGEERDVLLEQRASRRGEAAELLTDFVTEIVRARQEGNVDDTWTSGAAEFLDLVDRQTDQETQRTAAELKKLRAAREDAAPEELVDIDDGLGRANVQYDDLLRSRFDTSVAREELGLDAEKSYARFEELLQARTEERAGQVRVTRRRIVDLSRQAAAAEEEEAKRLRARVVQQQALLDARVDSLRRLSVLLDKRQLPSAEYRQLVIEASGQVTIDIFDREVALGLLQRSWKRTKAWMSENAAGIAFNLLLALLLLFASHLLGRLSQRLVRRGLQRSRTPVSQLFQSFLLTSVYRVAVGLGILIALAQVGVEIAPLLAGLGVASFIVGFALQDTLSNFASGMLILAYRPFDVGDVVNAAGVAGRVEAMTLVTTTILTFDNQRLIVPNSKIWGDVITNVTAERMRRVDLAFGIGYDDDIEHAEKVLRDIVASHAKILETPEPVIRLHELGDSSVNFVVRPWARTVDYWDVYWDVTREVKRRFDAEGISIPFPQRDMHIYPKAERDT